MQQHSLLKPCALALCLAVNGSVLAGEKHTFDFPKPANLLPPTLDWHGNSESLLKRLINTLSS
tara:strand:+ start:660 stop:848 length:189 start_codon:yes stop_codon:yes gene_type:complete